MEHLEEVLSEEATGGEEVAEVVLEGEEVATTIKGRLLKSWVRFAFMFTLA